MTIEPFRPVKMMLAQAGTIAAQIEDHGEVAVEYKYDGSRFQFHKVGDVCRIYSRKLEDVTESLPPDIANLLLEATDHDVILDGEAVAVRDGRPMPFQYVIRRFRRKHGVDSMMEKIELVPKVFDILYLDGETLMDRPPLAERRKASTKRSVRTSLRSSRPPTRPQRRRSTPTPRPRARGRDGESPRLALHPPASGGAGSG